MSSLTDQIKDFSETSTGRIVVVAVPAVILALIIAFVALTMMRGNAQSGVETTGAESTETSSAVAAKDSTETGADLESGSDGDSTLAVTDTSETTTAYITENYEVYETRDPFEVYDTSAALTGSSGSSSNSSGGGSDTSGTAGTGGGSGTTADAQTLMLERIADQDGVAYAVVKYGSVSYTVKAGEQVGTSPYKVVSVASDSATFLYGDDQVELAVGESVDK